MEKSFVDELVMFNITNKLLDDLDYSKYKDICPNFDMWFHFYRKRSGEAHYRLLSQLSLSLNNSHIIDIGTATGSSALALSYNENNIVYSFDLQNRVEFLHQSVSYQTDKNMAWYNTIRPPTVNFIQGDFYHFRGIVLSSPLILFDVNHSGEQEIAFQSWLRYNKYCGMVIYDDIHLNNEMKIFWDQISEKKYDVTSLGNQSGTGIVLYGQI